MCAPVPAEVPAKWVWTCLVTRAKMRNGMKGKKHGRTAFTLVLDPDAARVRKTTAPAGKPHADLRRKPPRRRPDHLAETSHYAETDA